MPFSIPANCRVERGQCRRLGTAYTNQSLTDAQGNKVLQAGTYTDANGVVRIMNDIWFAVDTARTKELNDVVVSAEIAAMPDLQGFGNVHSLHQATARDTSGNLQSLVSQFSKQSDPALRRELLTQIITPGPVCRMLIPPVARLLRSMATLLVMRASWPPGSIPWRKLLGHLVLGHPRSQSARSGF